MKKYSDLVYLDHNATTYLDDRVLDVMLPYLKEKFANPSSVYRFSQNVKMDLGEAKQKLLDLLGARNGKLIVTGGGSEANNLAIKGYLSANEAKGKHIITSAIEHHSVLHTCQDLKDVDVTYVPVDKYGLIDLKELRKAIREETALITIMYANNETGVIQPIEEVLEIAKKQGIAVHTDAVQIIGKKEINIEQLGVDMLTFSAHKFYGSKGVGGLYVKKGIKLDPQVRGGRQEQGLRAGTENVAGTIGMAKALEIALENWSLEWEREEAMRNRLQSMILENIPEVLLNGHLDKRLANTLNVIFKYVEGEGLILMLDRERICVSSGSACTSGTLDPSHVLLAMDIPVEFAHGSLRFSFGRLNEEGDVDKAYKVVKKAVDTLRSMSPLWPPR